MILQNITSYNNSYIKKRVCRIGHALSFFVNLHEFSNNIKMNVTKYLYISLLASFALHVGAKNPFSCNNDTIGVNRQLQDVQVVSNRIGMRRMPGAGIGQIVDKSELFRAACCNLGESFTTNPSVDVNYSDAATGAKQIKLLGLSGTYVQMLTENIPNFRGAAMPFSLGYVPGPWMKSIQVSKGASSVRNGYESITGQINVQYLQPEEEQGVTVNLYGDSKSRFEANADGNIHLNPRLSAEVLMHYENSNQEHDENNDGFMDKPNMRQYNLQNRWAYLGSTYIFHGGLSLLGEEREGGQTMHSGIAVPHPVHGLYKIGVDTKRYEMYMKHAFVLNKEHGTNLALMLFGSIHDMDADYGLRAYDVNQKNFYAQLMYETNFTDMHNLSAGLSFNRDYYKEDLPTPAFSAHAGFDRESVTGVYAQYTYNLNSKFVAMAGLRGDISSEYDGFITPRMHLKWMPSELVTFRGEIGKGYRSAHILAENHNLLASSRRIVDTHWNMEEAWNYGFSAGFNIPIGNKDIKLNAEYYYTDFENQAVIDFDTDPSKILVYDSEGQGSFSHVFQIDATCPVYEGFTLTAAYRRNIVKATYGGELLAKPLTNKYKGLISAGYKTPLGLWQFDVTLQLNGGGRMPKPYKMEDGTMSWNERFHSFEQLSAQVTRWFRHFSIYVGGENLTGFKQKNPIICANDPWGKNFDSTLVWGPIHGAMAYAGIRINIGKL